MTLEQEMMIKEEKARQQGALEILIKLVNKQRLTISEAAEEAGMTEAEFREASELDQEK